MAKKSFHHDVELHLELRELQSNVTNAIKAITYNPKRKYPPFNWTTESVEGHLLKGVRHLLTFNLQRVGQQKPDNEDHFVLGICRISMAYSLWLRSEATRRAKTTMITRALCGRKKRSLRVRRSQK